MLFGNSTEPSYAGIRVPRLYSGDDAVLTRQVSPQERYRQYNGASRTEAEQRRLNQVLEDKEKEAEAPRNGKLQGAIQGLGGSLAEIFAQNDQRQPLSLPPVMMGEQIPIIDPRWLPRRENGGPVKKNRPYLVGEDGPEVIVPEDDGTVIPNGRRSVDWDLKEILNTDGKAVKLSNTVTPQEETVTETVTETPEPSTADMLRGQVNDIQRRLAKGATKNPDGTTTYGDKQYRKRNALDVLKSAGLGVLQSLASAPPTNDLGALLGRAIGGGAVGGVMGATMNNADEKMQDRMKLAQILPQYQQAAEVEQRNRDAQYKQAQTLELLGRPAQRIREIEARSKAAIDRLNRNADIRAGIAKPVINEAGYIELEYLNSDASGKRRENELLKGADGQPIFVPGEQGLTWIDPLTKKPMQVRAKQTLMPGATIATGNANRQTEADKANAEKYWRTQDINIQNQMKWMSDIKSLMTQAIAADSGIADDTGTRTEMDAKLNEIKALSNSPLPDTDDPSKAQEDRVKRVNKLVDDYNQLQNQFLTNISKTAAGKAKADQIRGVINSMTKPEVLTYEPYKPTMVTGGVGGRYAGQSFPSPEALQKAFPGKSVADIKAIVEGQGGRFLN